MTEKFKVAGERPTVAKRLLDKHWKRSTGSYGDAHECHTKHSDKALLKCHLEKWEKNLSGKVQVTKLIDFAGEGKYIVLGKFYTESENIHSGADTSSWGYAAAAFPSYQKAIAAWEYANDSYIRSPYEYYDFVELHPIIIELP